jgi:predicted GH43/DUF377 family glycosyl hydrolase
MKVKIELKRSNKNPILKPRPEIWWDSKSVCNSGVIEIERKIYLVYSAKGTDRISRLGWAELEGIEEIKERSDFPIFQPREYFEIDSVEDPRIHLLADFPDQIEILYAGKQKDMARIGRASIKVEDFKNKRWNWSKHQLLLSPLMGYHNRNGAFFPKKIGGRYALLHRPVVLSPNCPLECIWILYSDDFEYWYQPRIVLQPRPGYWDDQKVGIAGPPIELGNYWLIIYHGVEAKTHIYRLGWAILEKDNPIQVVARAEKPLLEPEKDYEEKIVFSCGQIVRREGEKLNLILYYGAADKVIGVAKGEIQLAF